MIWVTGASLCLCIDVKHNISYCSNSPILKHSTVQSIAFCMRKNAPTNVSVSKSFPGWYPRTLATGRGDPLSDPPPARPTAVFRGASAPDVETSIRALRTPLEYGLATRAWYCQRRRSGGGSACWLISHWRQYACVHFLSASKYKWMAEARCFIEI